MVSFLALTNSGASTEIEGAAGNGTTDERCVGIDVDSSSGVNVAVDSETSSNGSGTINGPLHRAAAVNDEDIGVEAESATNDKIECVVVVVFAVKLDIGVSSCCGSDGVGAGRKRPREDSGQTNLNALVGYETKARSHRTRTGTLN